MRDMTGIIRARQEMGQNVDKRPEMGEYLNAPAGQVQRAPSLREKALQAAMRLGLVMNHDKHKQAKDKAKAYQKKGSKGKDGKMPPELLEHFQKKNKKEKK